MSDFSFICGCGHINPIMQNVENEVMLRFAPPIPAVEGQEIVDVFTPAGLTAFQCVKCKQIFTLGFTKQKEIQNV
jgi:hypothetical protein